MQLLREHATKLATHGKFIKDFFNQMFQTKYTGIPALISAFDRVIAQFTWPRVWPREPFGEGRCTSGYMLKWVANPSSD